VPVTPLAITVVGFAVVPPYTVYEPIEQLAGGVVADQLKPMALEEDAVAVKPVGAEGTALQEADSVAVEACVEAADAPSASLAFTT
jgi:hypothetical protein